MTGDQPTDNPDEVRRFRAWLIPADGDESLLYECEYLPRLGPLSLPVEVQTAVRQPNVRIEDVVVGSGDEVDY